MTARSVGLALADGRGRCATWRDGRSAPHDARTLDLSFDAAALAAGEDAALQEIMQTARRSAPSADTVHVALHTPWSTTRQIALPPVRRHEADAIIARDAARYFPAVHAQPVVVVHTRVSQEWLVSDADGVVLDAIHRAAQQAGFARVRIVPAPSALAHAAGSASAYVAAHRGEATIVSAARGQLAAVRRCRAADLPDGHATQHDAMDIAARHAPACIASELAGPQTLADRRRISARLARRLAVLGITLTVAAAAIWPWAAWHRVARLDARRAALRPVVAPALAMHDSLTTATAAIDALTAARVASPRWLARIEALAAALPDGASIHTLRADADSIVVEGRADDASDVLARIRQSPLVAGVRGAAPALSESGPVDFSIVVWFREGTAP